MTGEGRVVAPHQQDDLRAVRTALLSAAHQSADQIAGTARDEAAAVTRAARQEADRILSDARAQGRADGAAFLAADVARARREARTAVLRAQRAAYQQLVDRSRSAARQLSREPAYASQLDRLSALVRRQMGDAAEIRRLPSGGLLAETPMRRIDLSADALVDRAIEELGGDICGLWAP